MDPAISRDEYRALRGDPRRWHDAIVAIAGRHGLGAAPVRPLGGLLRRCLTTCPRHPADFVAHRERFLPGGAGNSIELGQDDSRRDRFRTICVRDGVIELSELCGRELHLGLPLVIHCNCDDRPVRERHAVGNDDPPADTR